MSKKNPLPLARCARCGAPFEPYWLNTLNAWSRLCNRCTVLNLANFFEHIGPDDTNREISQGEQIGAWLRDNITKK